MKRLLLIFLFFIPLSENAQVSYKWIKLDTAKAYHNAWIQLMNPLRFLDGTTQSTAGGTYTASKGIQCIGNDFQLGGRIMNANTSITNPTHNNFTFGALSGTLQDSAFGSINFHAYSGGNFAQAVFDGWGFHYLENYAYRNRLNGWWVPDKNYVDSINKDCPQVDILDYTPVDPKITCASQIFALRAIVDSVPVSYLWSENCVLGDRTDTAQLIFEAGTYTVTVTNLTTGCKTKKSININLDNDEPYSTAFVSGVVDTIPTYIIGQVNVTIPKAGHTYSYNWNGGLTDVNPTKITAPGTYSCYVTDLNNGCVNDDAVLVVKPSYFYQSSFIQSGTDTTNSTPLRKGNIFVDNSGNVYISKNASRGGWVKLN